MSAATKQFIGAIALVRRDGPDGRDEWLALWNAGRDCYQFVEAHKLDDESFRQSLIREIAWTTGLGIGKDFLVAGGPRAHLQFSEAEHGGADPVWFIVEFYLVELMGQRHRGLLDGNHQAHWITAGDIGTGTARDGRPICPRLISLLMQADLLLPHQA